MSVSWEIRHGDVLERLREMPDCSVQCCVTSPPYFRQRDYGLCATVWGDGWVGCLGMEATAGRFVAHLVEVFAEVRRVLRDDGSLWLNLDDRYVAKRLLGVPWRAALALQDDGWLLRCDVIWSKRNLKPEGSAKDRPTRSHEYLFQYSKSERYFYDAGAVREPSVSARQEAHNQRYARTYQRHTERARRREGIQPGNVGDIGIHGRPGRGGRNRRSVWSVSSVRVPGAHFASFPAALIEPCILASSRPGDLVLDPFAGSGTTLLLAARHGRRSIGIELNRDYAALAERRLATDSPTTPDSPVIPDKPGLRVGRSGATTNGVRSTPNESNKIESEVDVVPAAVAGCSVSGELVSRRHDSSRAPTR